jgi:hypothetical protein
MLAAPTMWGQATSGDLVGTVVDNTGALVPNAKVTATNVATNVSTSTTTNANGEYRFGNLQVGTYNVRADAQGFAPKSVQVLVELNKTATGRIGLEVGPASTTVEVTGAAPAIDTTTAQLETTYDLRQAADLPIAGTGSGVLNLSLLQAGVASTGGLGAGSGPSVGGQRPRNNNFTVEGVDNNNKTVTGPNISIPNDAVQNFTVMQNQFSPEFGHSTGGQFNQTVLSGTNQFHGRAYEYFQNRNLNALDVSRRLQGITENPRYDNNRYGGQIGGPIVKNRLFFFANYTYQTIGQSTTPSSSVLAPTAAGYAQLGAVSGLSATNIGVLKQFATAPASNGLATCNKSAPQGVLACVNGRAIDVGILPINAPNFTNNKFLVTSMDYNITDSDKLRGRYVYNQQATIDTAATLPVFYQPLTVPYHLFTLSEYHTFTPSVTNELRLGFNRFAQNYTVGNQKFPGLDQFPNIMLEELNLNIGPDPNAPQFTIQNLYQATDNVTWVKGNHTFKFGVDAAEYISPQSFTQRARGDYDYSEMSGFVNDAVPDVLAERSLGNNTYYGNQYWIYSYFNDSWKIRPTFTLNLGLRHEYLSIPQGWGLQALNSAASVPGLITFNKPKAPTKDFAPRVGFAWAPGNGNTSIRGGFGMGYDVLYDNIGVLSLPPQLSQTSDCPGGPGCGPDSGFLKGGGITPFTGVPTLDRAFCTNIVGVPVTSDANCARLLTAGYLPNGDPTDVKYPYSEQWNFGVQHAFGTNYTAEVRYVGTQGVHLNVQDRLNRISSVDATHNLPLFRSTPSAATVAGLGTTLTALQDRFKGPFGGSGYDPVYASQGFGLVSIVGFMPYGQSNYNGLQTQLTRRLSNGLQFQVAYTWSKTIDNSTADFFSTVLSPRRPQDFRDFHSERSNSPLDHTHRLTVSAIYDLPFFKNSNWFLKNVVGNWEIAPIYTYESGGWADPQSQQDANLNGDTAGDRIVINPSGNRALSSDVTAVKNAAGATVGYTVDNPAAYWIRARPGMIANSSRNILQMRPIDNVDLSLMKRISVTERYHVEFGAQALNALNHPQFIPGYLNDIASIGQTSSAATTYLVPGQKNFNDPTTTFQSNSRTLSLLLRFIF